MPGSEMSVAHVAVVVVVAAVEGVVVVGVAEWSSWFRGRRPGCPAVLSWSALVGAPSSEPSWSVADAATAVAAA